MHIIPFSEIRDADLQVDAIYQGKRKGNAADDPLPHLLKVSNSGGFRYRGSLDALELVVLTSTLKILTGGHTGSSKPGSIHTTVTTKNPDACYMKLPEEVMNS